MRAQCAERDLLYSIELEKKFHFFPTLNSERQKIPICQKEE